jgi:hypothetical protein
MFCWPTVTTAGANANLISTTFFREYTRRAAVTTVLTGNALTESYVHIRLVYSNNRIDIIGST